MTDTIAVLHDGVPLLSVHEVATLLNVSVLTIYRLVDRRQLSVHRIARRLRFSSRDLARFLAAGKTPDTYVGPQT